MKCYHHHVGGIHDNTVVPEMVTLFASRMFHLGNVQRFQVTISMENTSERTVSDLVDKCSGLLQRYKKHVFNICHQFAFCQNDVEKMEIAHFGA